MFPRIEIHGDPRTRGRMYGEQAADRIHHSIEAYARLFEHYAGWDWTTVTEHAEHFVAPIERFDGRYVEEMRGIAEGAAVPFEDIVAINVRTEIMLAGKARSAAASLPRGGECTAFSLVPPPDSDRHVLVGQNWDWTLHAADTVVIVEAHQDEGPSYVTIVEAGLLAKAGFNSHGVGLTTATLVSDRDLGEPGVPYHVLLRAVLDAATPSDALALLQQAPRSSSATYVIGHRSGLGIIIEATPGDYSQLRLIQPDERGILVHGNHFEHPRFDAVDVGSWLMHDSPFRVQRARAHLRGAAADATPWTLTKMFSDHAGEPSGICCHPVEADHPLEQFTTVFSVVMDVASSTMLLTEGSPCAVSPDELEYREFFTAA